MLWTDLDNRSSRKSERLGTVNGTETCSRHGMENANDKYRWVRIELSSSLFFATYKSKSFKTILERSFKQ